MKDVVNGISLLEAIENVLESRFEDLAREFFISEEYFDDTLYDMDDFDELMYGMNPHDIARKIWFGDFNPMSDYWKFDGYGNLESFEYVSDWIDCYVPESEFYTWLLDGGYITSEEVDEQRGMYED